MTPYPELENLCYPIGRNVIKSSTEPAVKRAWIKTISDFPVTLEKAIRGLSEEDLNTPYRPNGWTIRQVVHHCADSHMNALIRFKRALTEDNPTISPYFEDRWAIHPDEIAFPIESSLAILQGVHARWSHLLLHLTEEDFQRTYMHPQYGATYTLTEVLSTYEWHCRHHLAHIELAKKTPVM